MARRDEDNIAFRKSLFVENQAAAVDRQRGDVSGPLLEDVPKIRIGRVLNDSMAVFRNQKLRDEIERVLGAERHQYLFRPRRDAAPRQASRADIVDQHRIVAQPEITDHAAEIAHAERLPRAVAPGRQRKQLVIDLPIDKGKRVFAPVQRLPDRPNAGARSDKLVLPVDTADAFGVGHGGRLHQAADRRFAADDIARPLARLDVAGVNQRLIGKHHRVARHAKLPGQRTA